MHIPADRNLQTADTLVLPSAKAQVPRPDGVYRLRCQDDRRQGEGHQQGPGPLRLHELQHRKGADLPGGPQGDGQETVCPSRQGGSSEPLRHRRAHRCSDGGSKRDELVPRKVGRLRRNVALFSAQLVECGGAEGEAWRRGSHRLCPHRLGLRQQGRILHQVQGWAGHDTSRPVQ